MSKGIFITGTGTDIGKTYVTALIIKRLREAGFDAGYYKAALSGAIRTKEGLHIEDAYHVKKIANLDDDYKDMVSYVYESAVAPHLAAKIEGNPVSVERIKSDYKKMCLKYEFVTVEGSGGIICPIRFDDQQHIFLTDIIKELKLSVLIIAQAGLGTINDTVLTVKYLENENIKIKGIILNRYRGGIMEEDNIKMIEKMTNVAVIALVREKDSNIKIDSIKLKSIYEKDDK